MCARVVMVDVRFPISTVIPGHARAAMRTPSTAGALRDTLYVFRWNRLDRKGQTCRVMARGAMNSCLVEFEDGWRMVTSRNALRRKK